MFLNLGDLAIQPLLKLDSVRFIAKIIPITIPAFELMDTQDELVDLYYDHSSPGGEVLQPRDRPKPGNTLPNRSKVVNISAIRKTLSALVSTTEDTEEKRGPRQTDDCQRYSATLQFKDGNRSLFRPTQHETLAATVIDGKPDSTELVIDEECDYHDPTPFVPLSIPEYLQGVYTPGIGVRDDSDIHAVLTYDFDFEIEYGFIDLDDIPADLRADSSCT